VEKRKGLGRQGRRKRYEGEGDSCDRKKKSDVRERDDEKAGERKERLESEREKEDCSCIYESEMKKNEKDNSTREGGAREKGRRGETVNEERESRRRSEMERAKGAHKRGGTQPSAVNLRLAICVVFYDNYKYGRKALCLEQLVRLSKLCPYSPPIVVVLFRLYRVGGGLHVNMSLVRTLRTVRFFWGGGGGRVPGPTTQWVDRSIKKFVTLRGGFVSGEAGKGRARCGGVQGIGDDADVFARENVCV